MSVYLYPKSPHIRVLNPRQRKNYSGYKPYLQREFCRVCVYCRQPDSHVAHPNFGVDHYRPKKQFTSLVAAYDNLYYCCSSCNSRKGSYWPDDEAAGPYVVNPCEHTMASHLRFERETGRISTHSVHAEFTEELLQLNETTVVAYRRQCLRKIESLLREVAEANTQIKQLNKKRRLGTISVEVHAAELESINLDLELLRACLDSEQGTKPLLPIRRELPH